MNILESLFEKYNSDKGSHHKYSAVYEPLFNLYRDKPINFLEIGIYNGGSIKAFKEYFPLANIYAIDIEDKRIYQEDRIFIELGDQSDRNFIKNVFPDVKFDFIIDDGSHQLDHQFISFDELFPRLKSKGVYIIEDLHTSLYYPKICDECNSPLNFVEDISNNININISKYPLLLNINDTLNDIKKCNVYKTNIEKPNNGMSITSSIFKK
jgi:hypothetical protein